MLGPHDDGGLEDSEFSDDGGAAAAARDAVELLAAVPLPAQQQRQPQPVTFGAVADQGRKDVASLHTKLLAIHADAVSERRNWKLESKDAIKFYKDVQRKPENKQQVKANCMACGKLVSSTGSNRLVVHLLQCPLMPLVIRRAFKELQEKSKSASCGKREAEAVAAQEAEVFAKRFAAEQAVLCC